MQQQSAVQTRAQVIDQAIRENFYNPPVKIRRNTAAMTAAFLRFHFDQYVAFHMRHGSTGSAAESAINELEVQI